jgi:hypothetical protein
MTATREQDRGCPLWVKSRHDALELPCPLYPRKRTSFTAAGMSALRQKQTFARLLDMIDNVSGKVLKLAGA